MLEPRPHRPARPAEDAAREREARLAFAGAPTPTVEASRRRASAARRPKVAGTGGPQRTPEPITAEIRAWARAASLPVAAKGRLLPGIRAASLAADVRS